MKKLLCAILCVLMIAGLAGCAKKQESVAAKAVACGELYNQIAQTAIDNGWEEDEETLVNMELYASKIEEFYFKLESELEDEELDDLEAEIDALSKELKEEAEPLVSVKFAEEGTAELQQ